MRQFRIREALLIGILATGMMSSAAVALAKDVLATVGTETITKGDLEDRVASFPAQYQKTFAQAEAKSRLLDQMIDEKLILVAAKKSGLEKQSEYKKQLQAAQTQLLMGLYVRDRVEKRVSITDDEVKQYFQNNPQLFQELEQRRASHILVKTEAEANDVIAKLKAGGDFTTLAKEKSIDPSAASNGGDLGFFAKGQMVPEFENSVFSMAKGELSGPIKTQYGYHVIRLVDITVRPKIEFTPEVQAQLKNSLLDEKRRQVISLELEKLRKDITVKKDSAKL